MGNNQLSNLPRAFYRIFLHHHETAKLLFFILVSTVSIINVVTTPQPLGFEDLSPIWDFSQLFRPFDTPWDYKSNLGTPNVFIGNAIYNIPIIAFSLLIGDVALAHKIWFILILALSGYGFSRFSKCVFNSKMAELIVGLYGIFNGWLIYHLSLGHNLVVLAYSLLPFCIIFYYTLMNDCQLLKILYTTLLAALISYITIHIGYLFFIFALTYTVIVSLFSKNTLKEFIKNLAFFTSVTSLTSILLLPLILNFFFLSKEVYTIRAEDMISFTMNFNDVLTSNLSSVLQLCIILLFGIYATIKMDLLRRKSFTPLLLTLLILSSAGFILYSGVYPHLTILLYWYIPGFAMLRELHKTLLFGVYLLAYLLAAIIVYLRRTMQSKVLTLTLLAIITLSAIYPALSGQFTSSIDTVPVPPHYMTLYNALNSDQEYYRVAFIPPAIWATLYNWSNHFFLDPIVSLQAKPTLQIKSEMDCTLAARFTRWVYYSLYKMRIKDVGSLFGIAGVKYMIFRRDAYMREDRADLSLFTQKKSEDVLSEAEGIEHLDNLGSIEIYEVKRRLPHIYGCDEVSLIVGDRRALLTMLKIDEFDPLNEPSIFIDNLDDIGRLLNYTRTFYIDPLRFEDIIVGLATDKILYKAWENLPLSSNIQERWIRGDFAWYMEDGIADAAPDNYAITRSSKPLTLSLNVPEAGNYRLLIQCFLVKGGGFSGLEISLDNNYLATIGMERANRLGNYKWIPVGDYYFASGIHEIEIKPKGEFAAVSKIALIPAKTYLLVKSSLSDALKGKAVSYIIDDYDWLNIEEDDLLENISFSNGFAVKINGESSIPLFVPESSMYELRVRAVGNGNFTLSIVNGKVELKKTFSFKTESLKTYTSPLNLMEGWSNLEVETDGDVYIDFIFLHPSQDQVKTGVYQPTVKMIDGSSYVVKNVNSNFIVFLEGWNSKWVLKSGDERVSPIIVFGFANLFKVPKSGGELRIEFGATDLFFTYIIRSVLLIIAVSILHVKVGSKSAAEKTF